MDWRMSGFAGGALFVLVGGRAAAAFALFFLFFMSITITPVMMAPITASPPTIPPMIGPIDVFLVVGLLIGLGLGVEAAPLLGVTVVMSLNPLPKAFDEPRDVVTIFAAEDRVSVS